jgi:hypothetical protein
LTATVPGARARGQGPGARAKVMLGQQGKGFLKVQDTPWLA